MKKRLLSLTAAVFLMVSLASPASAAPSPPSDTAPSELVEVQVYTPKTAAGKTLTVGVDVFDPDGLNVCRLRFINDETETTVDLELKETLGHVNASQRWSSKITLPSSLPLGEYHLQRGVFYDKQDNRTRYYHENDMNWDSDDSYLMEDDVCFTVVPLAEWEKLPKDELYEEVLAEEPATPSNDKTPPILDGVKVAEARSGSRAMEFRVEVKASDVGDGIRHISLRFKNKSSGKTVSKVLFADDWDGSVYSDWIEVSRYQPPGTFVLESVGLYDKAGNYASYFPAAEVTKENKKLPLPGVVSFVLDSSQRLVDSQPPTLHSLKLSEEAAATGSSISVKADVRDDISGVNTLSLMYKSWDNKSISVTLTWNSDELYGNIKSFQTRKAGEYTLERAIVTDNAGNRRSYYSTPNGRGEKLPFTSSFRLEEK